jgi:hypothetical protein
MKAISFSITIVPQNHFSSPPSDSIIPGQSFYRIGWMNDQKMMITSRHGPARFGINDFIGLLEEVLGEVKRDAIDEFRKFALASNGKCGRCGKVANVEFYNHPIDIWLCCECSGIVFPELNKSKVDTQ